MSWMCQCGSGLIFLLQIMTFNSSSRGAHKDCSNVMCNFFLPQKDPYTHHLHPIAKCLSFMRLPSRTRWLVSNLMALKFHNASSVVHANRYLNVSWMLHWYYGILLFHLCFQWRTPLTLSRKYLDKYMPHHNLIGLNPKYLWPHLSYLSLCSLLSLVVVINFLENLWDSSTNNPELVFHNSQ